MGQLKTIILRLLTPPPAVTGLLSVSCAAGLGVVFYQGWDTHLLAYPLYVLSFYTLCILIRALIPLIRTLHQRRKNSKRSILPQQCRRRELYTGLIINLCYAVLKLATGFLTRSVWFCAVGGYYLVLSLIHGYLLGTYRSSLQIIDLRRRTLRSWHSYRRCGWLILILNLTMTGMVFMMIWRGQSYTYPGILIYATAAYTFYRITMVILQTVKMKRSDEPIFSAAHSVDFCMAVMSVFTLQTAMFASFGGQLPLQTQRLMNSLTGGAVCFTVMCVAVFMIIYPTRELQALQPEQKSEH